MIREVKFKNFGKLRDTAIRLNRFTVFAGKNGTGKSFASKAIYSLINAARTVNVVEQTQERIMLIYRKLNAVIGENLMDDSGIPKVEDELKRMHNMLESIRGIAQSEQMSALESKRDDIAAVCGKIAKLYQKIDGKIASYIINHGELDAGEEAHLDMGDLLRLRNAIKGIENLGNNEFKNLFHEAFHIALARSMLYNFQTVGIFDLYNQRDSDMEIEVDSFADRWTVYFPRESATGYTQRFATGNDGKKNTLRMFYEAFGDRKEIYLESPVISQLKGAIEAAREKNRNFSAGSAHLGTKMARPRSALTGVPRYHYDMFTEIKKKYAEVPNIFEKSGKSDFADIGKRLSGEKVLNGKVSITDMTDEMMFTENDGGSYPLVRTASGVANLGVLAMILENNILGEDDFLFFDEPEAHLHPAWQVEMAEALFALAEAGVNVIVATHSADILKWLEVRIQKKPKSGDIVALNHFHKDGVDTNGGELMSRLNAVQKELVEPYYDLYYEGL